MNLHNVFAHFILILLFNSCLAIPAIERNDTSIYDESKTLKLSDLIDQTNENTIEQNTHSNLNTTTSKNTPENRLPNSIKKDIDSKLTDDDSINALDVNHKLHNQTNEYRCKSSDKQIDVSLLCDGFSDCELGDDEEECKGNCSEQNKFQCRDDKRCIDLILKCNSFPDCKDGSDEEDCDSLLMQTECSKDEFECSSGGCISRKKVCDRSSDCDDSSDELYCKYTCNDNKFQCKDDKRCIDLTFKCNSIHDCKDGSDEEDCLQNDSANYTCAANEFSCQMDPHKCISIENVCNDFDDCGNNADEPPECTMDLCKNHHCAHSCTQVRNSVKCTCNDGYKLSANGADCVDLNECLEITGFCSNHECINRNGTATCLCASGYRFNANENRCKVINGHNASLIYSNQNELRTTTLSTLLNRVYLPSLLQNINDPEHKNEVIRQNLNAIGMFVYNFANNYIVWHDMNERRFYIASLDEHKRSLERNEFFTKFKLPTPHHRTPRTPLNRNQHYVLLENVTNVEGMALDYVHDLLYWTDTDRNVIEVAEVKDPSKRRILVDSDLDEPKGIVVDVDRSFILFTDWGNKPKIEYIKQDGTGRRTIYDKDLEWPYSIALDTHLDKIYWVDTKKNTLNAVDLNGENHQVLLTNSMYLERANDLDVFEDKIYWSDQESESILSVDKFTPKSTLTVLVKDLKNVLSLKIVHYSKQQSTIQGDLCAQSNCEFMCLPRNDFDVRKYTCACPDSSSLRDDAHSCVPVDRSKATQAIAKKNVYNVLDNIFDSSNSYRTNTNAIFILALAVLTILLVTVICFYLLFKYAKKKANKLKFNNAQYQKTPQQEEKPLPYLEPLVDQPTTNEFA